VIRQFPNLVLTFSLIAGGWGCALAAAFCGHPGCGPSVVSAGHGQSVPGGGGAAGHGEHEGHPGADAHAGHSEHDSSAAEHSGHDPSGETLPDAGQSTPATDLPTARLAPGTAPCGHCVGAPGQRSTKAERQADQPQRQDHAGDPPQTRRFILPDTTFVREVIPYQGAPPGRVSAHVLNSVFRI
jgi:hypothetical protein